MNSYGEMSRALLEKKHRETFIRGDIDSELLGKLIGCVEEVNTVIETTSALPGYENNAEAVDNARKLVDQSIVNRLKNMNNIKENLLLKLLNIGIKSQKAGNCYEYSFLGQSYLEKENLPNEIFRIKGHSTKDSHVFLVVNRDLSTDPNDFNTWNKDTIIVDTYMKQIYFANEIPIYLQSCLYNEETSTVSYIPFNSNEHTLDNNVRKEFIEDWQNVMKQLKVTDEESSPPQNSMRFT